MQRTATGRASVNMQSGTEANSGSGAALIVTAVR
jgi:hypothetical protein